MIDEIGEILDSFDGCGKPDCPGYKATEINQIRKAVMEVIGPDAENVMNRMLQEAQRQRANKFFGEDK